MPMVRIRGGWLKVGRRQRPGHPDIGLPEEPEGEGPVDPDYGLEGPGGEIDNELPTPPPGIWPPLTPEQPWRPIGGVDPGYGIPGPRPPTVGGGPARPPRPPGTPDQGLPGEGGEVEPPMVLPPGTIWPPLPEGVHGKYLALVFIGGVGAGYKYRYVVIDADLKPGHPIAPTPGHPIAPGGPDTPTPKR